MTAEKKSKPLGELLKEKGMITDDHIRYALQVQKITKEKVGEIFERLGFVTEYEVVTTLSVQEGIPYRNLDEVIPSEDTLKLFNKNICLNNFFLPIGIKDKSIEITANDFSDPKLTQLISRQTGLSVSHVSRIFRGLRQPSVHTLKVISQVVGLRPGELLTVLDEIKRKS